MTRVEIDEATHKKVKRYALEMDITIPEAYAVLIENSLNEDIKRYALENDISIPEAYAKLRKEDE